MSQISHPAGAPQIRTSRSFLTELAPALRTARCGRSWISKPAWMGASPTDQPEGPDKAQRQLPERPAVPRCANQADARWQGTYARRLFVWIGPFLARGFLADVVGLCLPGYPAQIS